jgi:transposase, IS5 family
MGLFVRTIGIDRATTKIGMANIAYNLTRYVWHEGRIAPRMTSKPMNSSAIG